MRPLRSILTRLFARRQMRRYLVSSESYWAQGIKARSKKEAIETFLYVYGEEPTKVERID